MKARIFRGRALRLAAWLAPALVLLLLAASPFLFRAWQAPRAVHITKVALLAAFSGQLQARGSELATATQLALAAANARPSAGGGLAMLTALDDQGRPGAGADMARTAAADPGVAVVLCCTTQAAYASATPLLPKRETLLSLLPAANAAATAEADLAARQFGPGPIALVSAVSDPEDSRAAALAAALSRAGFAVQAYRVDFAAGDAADLAAATIAAGAPRLVVLDADYPSAAVVATALRGAGVTAPLLGDDRLDGAPAAALLAGAAPWWYAAPDRDALLRQTPASFATAFAQQRGHPPSARDLLAYLQTEAALAPRPGAQTAAVPTSLYEAAPGQYPGTTRLTLGPNGAAAP